eukprot:10168645-Ditylum_brightwellii.AAC.1
MTKGNLGWGSIESSVITSMYTKGVSLEDGIDFIFLGKSNSAIKVFKLGTTIVDNFLRARVATEPLAVDDEADFWMSYH